MNLESVVGLLCITYFLSLLMHISLKLTANWLETRFFVAIRVTEYIGLFTVLSGGVLLLLLFAHRFNLIH